MLNGIVLSQVSTSSIPPHCYSKISLWSCPGMTCCRWFEDPLNFQNQQHNNPLLTTSWSKVWQSLRVSRSFPFRVSGLQVSASLASRTKLIDASSNCTWRRSSHPFPSRNAPAPFCNVPVAIELILSFLMASQPHWWHNILDIASTLPCLFPCWWLIWKWDC